MIVCMQKNALAPLRTELPLQLLKFSPQIYFLFSSPPPFCHGGSGWGCIRLLMLKNLWKPQEKCISFLLTILFHKASHIKSFVYGHPPASRKYFLIYAWILIIVCKRKKKTKTTKRHSTVINNFYFLVLNYFESWLNLMIVSVFVLESR